MGLHACNGVPDGGLCSLCGQISFIFLQVIESVGCSGVWLAGDIYVNSISTVPGKN